MNWEYILDRGIVGPDRNLSIFYGMNRGELRNTFNYSETKNKGRFDDEDNYENILGSTDWIRLGFNKEERLSDIELLEGAVIVAGVKVAIKGNLNETLSAFAKQGFNFKEGDYSFTCPELKIDLGNSNSNGGIENKIYWFYCSENFDI